MSELSIFLAKMLGLYFLLLGVVGLLRKEQLKEMIREIGDNSAILWTVAIVELGVGIAIITGHSIWTGWPIVISAIGWAFLAEALFYILFPQKTIKKLTRRLTRPGWYSVGVIITLALGLYLAGLGFAIL
ncbi:MAG: hypothetical protein WDZ70_00220 [Candidatus Paceibacterota bacterium]